MELNERKRKILNTIINEYISTAEPIGSRHIAKHADLGLSSATIRNEMADLEEMGYLEQPHTSAGRIPSDKGYRFYVNELMGGYEATQQDIDLLASAMTVKINQFDKVIKQVSMLLSRLTNYTAFLITPEMKHGAIKTIELIPIDNSSVLIVLVTNEGIMRNKRVVLPQGVDSEYIPKISAMLKEKLSGFSLDEIGVKEINEIKNALGENGELLFPVIEFISEIIDDIQKETEVYLSGVSNIFNFPEYRDIDRAKEFIEFLDDKNSVTKAISNSQEDDDRVINIKIGKENDMDIMQNSSLVTANYHLGGRSVGKIGIIGPTRMNYSKVVANINQISKYLEKLLEEMYFDNNGE
ncbi:MAG: heat-inducible transcription repressor HrcA [Clostridia bacterium]|nr:heat-inducible transcription repressor HrcA [Clostridia bacterium]